VYVRQPALSHAALSAAAAGQVCLSSNGLLLHQANKVFAAAR